MPLKLTSKVAIDNTYADNNTYTDVTLTEHIISLFIGMYMHVVMPCAYARARADS